MAGVPGFTRGGETLVLGFIYISVSCAGLSIKCRLIALGNFFPVDNIIKSTNIVRPAVLIVQVLSVLPYIQP